MIYVRLLLLYPLIGTVWKLQYSHVSHYVSFIKKAGIIALALCMSLNLSKYSSHLKENIKKKSFDFLTKFIEACLFYSLVVLHVTNNSSSFCHSCIAAEVPFQVVRELWLHDFCLSC